MKFIIGLFFLAIVFLLWYFFIDTLMLSELIGDDVDFQAGIFINLFDFDTGLTRYDVHNLESKAPYWEGRLQEIDGITDLERRNREYDTLLAEMTRDPSMKKVVKKVSGFGIGAVLAILKAISAF